MALIEVRQVEKIYNAGMVPVHALKGVSLRVEPGEFTVVVGPSGSGKTTLLNLIGGLDKPTSGTVLLDGIDLAALGRGDLVDFRLHHIGFVFQAYNLIPVLTAEENVEFVMLLQRKPREVRRKTVRDLLKAVGLGEKMRNRVSELSGGQQQRVAVARALASGPSYVLADEPTANLDSEAAGTLLGIMETLNRERKTTFVFSTHDPRVVGRARRVIRLVDGRVSEDTTRALT
ncbi:MAG TPA: ABC transporter ATP-binding protein [Bacteroidota bacterium]|nr:ABC transporter ATP-binding protein [Bacteroidota bacterium]